MTGLNAVSCADRGDCLAGGTYPRLDPSELRPMTASEAGGGWGPARRLWLPAGPADRDGEGQVLAVSCPTANWCAAAGLIGRSGSVPYGPTRAGPSWPSTPAAPGAGPG